MVVAKITGGSNKHATTDLVPRKFKAVITERPISVKNEPVEPKMKAMAEAAAKTLAIFFLGNS